MTKAQPFNNNLISFIFITFNLIFCHGASRADTALSATITTRQLWEQNNESSEKYDSPYSISLFSAKNGEDRARLWSKTKLISLYGLGVAGTIALLPKDISNWDYDSGNPLNNWWDNVRQGPTWDRDKWYFNYIGHPYSGGVYYQAARKSGYRQWDSFIYSVLMSTFYWEYGVEAFVEIPSVQDLVITPVLGWVYGEWALGKEQEIINNGGTVWGSPTMGKITLFLLDPVNNIGQELNNLAGINILQNGSANIGFGQTNISPENNNTGQSNKQFMVSVSYQLGNGLSNYHPANRNNKAHAIDPVSVNIVGISIGSRYIAFSDKWDLENTWAPSISLGLYFSPSFSSRLTYTRTKTTGTHYENYSLEAQYYLNPNGRLRPYIQGGLGQSFTEKNMGNTVFQLNAGLGLHYQILQNWAAQLGWVHYHSSQISANDNMFSSQLIYRFSQ